MVVAEALTAADAVTVALAVTVASALTVASAACCDLCNSGVPSAAAVYCC